MQTDALQEKAAHYVSGAMEASERANFEVLLECRTELRTLLAGLQDVTAAVAMADVGVGVMPPADLKNRLIAALEHSTVTAEPDGLVVTDAQGLIEWVSAGFSAMCGYSLDELRGKKPGHVLQGAETDAAAVARIRTGLEQRQDCREKLVNYHKDGNRYGVEVCIGGLWDDEGKPLAFVAREWKISA